MTPIRKIRQTIWSYAVVAPMIWVFGYIDGWGWLLQTWAVGVASWHVWNVWTGDSPDPWLEDEE